MRAIVCTLLSGAGFYLSVHLGELWPLAWLAPMPVLWLAFGESSRVASFAASFAAYALGLLNLLEAYAQLLPPVVLVLAITVPALCFAVSVMVARRVSLNVSPVAGVVAFAALWTSFDYALSFGPDGAATSPAYSQVAAVELIQGAAVFGLWVVTFLIGFVAAGVAMAAARKRVLPALFAITLFGLNAAFGVWRLSEAPQGDDIVVGLAADDSLGEAGFAADAGTAVATTDAYAAIARDLASRGASLIVLPEKFAVLAPEWRARALGVLQEAARDSGATIVAGFDERGDQRLNQAYVFDGGQGPRVYTKRRLVGGLERAFATGEIPLMLDDGTLVAICKDMDFPALLRGDGALGPRIAAVPAWDFDRDGWAHARMAIMRGVENGFAVARAARQGLLTLSDAYGRVRAQARSDQKGPVRVVARVSRGGAATLYSQLGDILPWVSIATAVLLVGLALAQKGNGRAGVTGPPVSGRTGSRED